MDSAVASRKEHQKQVPINLTYFEKFFSYCSVF